MLSIAGMVALTGSGLAQQGTVNLPSGKILQTPTPGSPARVNSLPLSLAVSPDGKYVASINAGYGTFESKYRQSIAVMNTVTGEVRDFPDERLGQRAKETYFSGLVFSPDGTKLYASMASITAAEGGSAKTPGNGIAVYSFSEGTLKAQDFLSLPLITLVEGRTSLVRKGHPTEGVPYPAAIAAVPGTTQLLVAENLADSVTLLDTATGKVVRNIDLSAGEIVPSTYPIAVAVTADGKRAFVALWNASAVAEVSLATGAVLRELPLLKPANPIDPGTHPCALLLDEKAGTLYVALSNRDAVAAIDIAKNQFAVKGYFDTRLPGQSYFGAEPDALAMNADGSRLYAANMGTDSIAVLDPHKMRSMAKAKGMIEPLGFVPTEMMPMALAESGGKVFVATGRGKGTGPNNMPQRAAPGAPTSRDKADSTYAPTLDYGSLASISESSVVGNLKASTDAVLGSNRMKAAQQPIEFAGGKNPIKHVIYIIKENRTYDQVFGDLMKDGQKVGNGDPSLTMYGATITPNQHKLVLQFGVLDNFFDSGEVSGEGHVWSNAAIGSDYMEKTWQINYRSAEHTYDYEGVVANGYPLLQHIPDLAEPSSGYLWTNFAKHNISLFHFGEYISSTFCTSAGDAMPGDRTMNPREGAMTGGSRPCDPAFIRPGEEIPAAWGGGKSLFPWAIPRLAHNQATKPELEGHYSQVYPDFNLMVPDQLRINVFLEQLKLWVAQRESGKDEMPSFIEVRLGNDHTAGTRPGSPAPKASVADNDLAIGRAVDAISHSAYWNDTAFFILEDDAQNGADHVDAHRSLAVVVSKYAPHTQPAFVDSTFYSTVSVIRTMETLLGAPPMNNNDAFAPMIASLFTGPGDQPAFDADYSNRDNHLIYTMNEKTAPGAKASLKMDFSRADHADPMKLNLILWQDAKGNTPPPAMILEKHKKTKDDDDN
jgi:DNA-binding beta-propeller fold protein YncE